MDATTAMAVYSVLSIVLSIVGAVVTRAVRR